MELQFKHRVTKELTESIEPIRVVAHTQWVGIFQADGSYIELAADNILDQPRIIFENGKIRTEGEFKIKQRTDTQQDCK